MFKKRKNEKNFVFYLSVVFFFFLSSSALRDGVRHVFVPRDPVTRPRSTEGHFKRQMAQKEDTLVYIYIVCLFPRCPL